MSMTSVNWFIGHIIAKGFEINWPLQISNIQQRDKVFSEVAFLFMKHIYIFCVVQNASVAVNFFHGF